MFGYSYATTTIVGTAAALALRNLYYTLTFKSLIHHAQNELDRYEVQETKEMRIAKQDMVVGCYRQLETKDMHEFAFALKPGFEEEFRSLGWETPLFHTACAYSVEREGEPLKWLVYGRQSPKFKTMHVHAAPVAAEGSVPPVLERKLSPFATIADNEVDYTLLERHPEDRSRPLYRLIRTGVYFSGDEIKSVIKKSNRNICKNLNTFITSNCYTFSVFCLTEFINLLLEKHHRPSCQRDNILKLYKILLEVTAHPVLHGQGIANNGPVRAAVYDVVEKVRRTILLVQPHLREAPAQRDEYDDLAAMIGYGVCAEKFYPKKK